MHKHIFFYFDILTHIIEFDISLFKKIIDLNLKKNLHIKYMRTPSTYTSADMYAFYYKFVYFLIKGEFTRNLLYLYNNVILIRRFFS